MVKFQILSEMGGGAILARLRKSIKERHEPHIAKSYFETYKIHDDMQTQTCMQEYASAGKVFSMLEFLNGCTFCTKLWAFSPLPPFKALP